METLSAQQEEAIKAVIAWSKDIHAPQIFRLFGFAGAGKTTIARRLANDTGGSVLFCAFTGKAASVMREKGCTGADTIHSLIYNLKEEEAGNPVFMLKNKGESEVTDSDLVIIDECSMVNDELANDFLSFGAKVLVLGDPAQLPPVKGTGFFTEAEPDFMLTEIHRQALENPIIALSMKIREGEQLDYGNYGSCKIIERSACTRETVLDVDQVIVGLNRTRYAYNDRIRTLLGYNSPLPAKGDKLVCLRNDRKLGLLNGTLWNVARCRKNKKNCFVKMSVIPCEGGELLKVKTRKEFFLGQEGNLKWYEKAHTQQFTYGYALTCHKSQGSQWENITVFDESLAFRENANRWLYTAITRASEKVTVVR